MFSRGVPSVNVWPTLGKASDFQPWKCTSLPLASLWRHPLVISCEFVKGSPRLKITLNGINFVDHFLNQGAPAEHKSAETSIGHESHMALSELFLQWYVFFNEATLETMCGGDFMSKNPEEAMDFLSYVAKVSRGWDEPNARDYGKEIGRARNEEDTKVQAISETSMKAMPCSICQSYKHLVEECPTIPAVREMFGDQGIHEVEAQEGESSKVREVKAVITLRSGLVHCKERVECEQESFIDRASEFHHTMQVLVKYKDPGCRTISVIGIGELKPISITLSLADRSVKIPRGMIEDVLVQVNKFYYPVDFVVLDMDPVVKGTNYVPIILGRPFLATSNAIINCRNGVMQLTFVNMTLELNIFHLYKKHIHPEEKEGLEEV
ncbi:hypothetical protein CK203_042761 [Vitis vinifera]|uniref:Uncharacterized protein n=1 Tax=Vitis vinifera TaxID=29760 RepID=A0A438HQN6_VITVI|nr:hypothetical protein CK203_042761 [Vitis vinifera]